MSKENENIIYGVREYTPFGAYMVASNLSRRDAIELLEKLEKEAKEQGTYYEDRFTLTYYRY